MQTTDGSIVNSSDDTTTISILVHDSDESIQILQNKNVIIQTGPTGQEMTGLVVNLGTNSGYSEHFITEVSTLAEFYYSEIEERSITSSVRRVLQEDENSNQNQCKR